MRVAFTSKSGDIIDTHFGQAKVFQVWDIAPDVAQFIETLNVEGEDLDEEDRISGRATMLEGCSIVYTVAIGGPAAAKLVARKIHPMKTNDEVPVAEIIARLQEVLQGNPPPWLRKAMNKTAVTAFDEE